MRQHGTSGNAPPRPVEGGLTPEVWWFDHIVRGSKYDKACRAFYPDRHRALLAVMARGEELGRALTDDECLQLLVELGPPEKSSKKEPENGNRDDNQPPVGCGYIPGDREHHVREPEPVVPAEAAEVDPNRDLGPAPEGWDDWGDW